MRKCRNRHFKKKRLRKLYHQGEFREIGFDMDAIWLTPPKDNDVEKASVKIVDFIDSIGLECGGGFSNRGISLFICKYKGNVTADDMLKVYNFFDSLKNESLDLSITIGNFKDTWYG